MGSVKKESVLLLLVFILVFTPIMGSSFNFISAAANTNVPNQTLLESRSGLCLNESMDIMNLMIAEGFNIIRINDSIKEARNIYDSQFLFKDKKRAYDFSGVISICNNIANIRLNAITSRDSFSSLLRFYNQSISDDMNSSSVDKIITEINSEMRDERYENIPPLIEKAYVEISVIQSTQTNINIFYKATTQGIISFLSENWLWIIIVLAIISVCLIFYRVKISLWIIMRKIEKLKNRKDTVRKLIMQTQKEYFQLGKIPEAEYNIKTKKYAELMRDIDRQIPLLREELAKLGSKE